MCIRDRAHILDQLTFSTERKFMATLVESPIIGKKVLYIKGAPEIVLGKCKEVVLEMCIRDSVYPIPSTYSLQLYVNF